MFLMFERTSAQLKIDQGANWVVNGNASVVLQDMNLANDGNINSGTGIFKFAGFQNSTISGIGISGFYILEMAKTNNTKVLLSNNININHSINFVSGQLDMNGKNIFLSPTANLNNETELNRITGTNGGYVQIVQTMNSPTMSNPGNLGTIITSSANLGSVTIRRGHATQNGTGITGSINRYYSIMPNNNSGLNATIRMNYFDAELNGQTENNLVIYQSTNGGTNWNNLSRTSNNSTANYVEKTAIASLAIQTLASDNASGGPGSVTGLVFTGSRKKATDVQLKWTTQTETNVQGFQVQRRLDTEADFTDRTFINSQAAGGNSSSSLSYQTVDANTHTGMSHYRLKIVDKANNITYSPIISVAGKTKAAGGKGGGGNGNGNNRMATEESILKVTVGPNPNNGNFWFTVTGIEKETAATLFTIDGKVMKQFKVFNMQQEKISGLRTGIYLLNVQGIETVRIVVQ